MKKTILIVSLLVGFMASGFAQSRALGIRSFQEISYQHAVRSNNMFQVDAGFYNSGIQATATYNWVFGMPWDYEGSWNWYIGPGASVALANDNAVVGAAGMIGVEYNFWFPLQLSIDYRPIIPLIGSDYMPFGFYTNSVGLGVRYKF